MINTAEVNVIDEIVEIELGLLICTQNLFALVHLRKEAIMGALIRINIGALGLKLFRKVINEGAIELATTEGGVPGICKVGNLVNFEKNQ